MSGGDKAKRGKQDDGTMASESRENEVGIRGKRNKQAQTQHKTGIRVVAGASTTGEIPTLAPKRREESDSGTDFSVGLRFSIMSVLPLPDRAGSSR